MTSDFICRPCQEGRCVNCTDSMATTADERSTGYCACDHAAEVADIRGDTA